MAVLSKIKLGNTTYDLKDADSRTKLSTLLGEHAVQVLGAAAWEGVDQEVTAAGAGLPTTGAVKSYVDAKIGTINKFDVRIYEADSEGKPNVVASAQTMYILALVADAQAASGSYIEWITIRNGSEGAYTYAWEKIGSTQADLGDYLKKTATVAGIAFGNDSAISVAELEAADALNLKALAHKASATGTVAGETITGVKATGNVDLELEGALAQTSTAASLTKGDYTPAGSITGAAISGGSITVTVKDASAATSAAITAESYTPAGSVAIAADAVNGTQISGSVSKPDVDVTPTDATFVQSLKASTTKAATYSHSGFSGGSLGSASTSSFATEGLVGEVGTGTDAETLILTAASTSSAVTAQGTFTPAEYGTDSFSAEYLPEVDGTAKALTGVTAALHEAPAFTGDKFGASFTGTAESNLKITDVKYLKQEIDDASFSGTAASLGFSGTKAENVLVTGVNYDKTSIGTLDVKAADIELNVGNIVVADKSVTVE